MQKIVDKSKCSGCSACYNICPKGCIEMKEDSEGFLYPVVDESLCVDCKKCVAVCPILKTYSGSSLGKAYACINKDEDIRMQSSSGGIFTLLAEHIIDRGGVVFGAAFDERFNVVHTEIKDKSELYRLRGSKYVQSTIGKSYQKVKKYLEEEKLVLFSGTPCQISGLNSYLGMKYVGLITVDIVCHGVPSPMVWRRYLEYRENFACASTRRTNFRHKKYGWNSFSVLLEYSNSTEYEQIFSKDLFMRGFLANLSLRLSCYNCHFKSVKRESDVTIADFWGIEKVKPELFDNKGTSLVLINTQRGVKLFDYISDKMLFKEVNVTEALKYNSAAYKSVKYNKNRNKFMRLIKVKPFDKAIEKSLKMPLKKVIIKGVRKLCSRIKRCL